MYVPDDTICTLSELFRHCVPLIDNKILIEDLEDLTAAHVGHGAFGSSTRKGYGLCEEGCTEDECL